MHVAVAHVKTYLRRVYFVSTSVSIIGVQIKVFISWFTATIFIIPMLLLICQYKIPSLVVTGQVCLCWWMIFTSYLLVVNRGVRCSSANPCWGPGAVLGCDWLPAPLLRGTLPSYWLADPLYIVWVAAATLSNFPLVQFCLLLTAAVFCLSNFYMLISSEVDYLINLCKTVTLCTLVLAFYPGVYDSWFYHSLFSHSCI